MVLVAVAVTPSEGAARGAGASPCSFPSTRLPSACPPRQSGSFSGEARNRLSILLLLAIFFLSQWVTPLMLFFTRHRLLPALSLSTGAVDVSARQSSGFSVESRL